MSTTADSPDTSAQPQSERMRYWWIAATLSLVLLGVGIQHMAARAWHPPSPDVVLAQRHHQLQVAHPDLFSEWALLADKTSPRAAGPPLEVPQVTQMLAGRLAIEHSVATGSVRSVLLANWAWRCGFRTSALETLEKTHRTRLDPLVEKTLALMKRLSGQQPAAK